MRDRTAEPFDTFARREHQALVALAWSLTGSFAAAEEIAQEALTAIWRSWDRVSGYDKPGAWTRRVVASRCSDHRRRAGREQRDGIWHVEDLNLVWEIADLMRASR